MGLEKPLSEPEAVRRYFDQLIILDELERQLQCERTRGLQLDMLI